MKIRINFLFTPERYHWLWAADMSGAYSMEVARDYLVEQIQKFGSDDYSLMGEQYDLETAEREHGATVDGWLNEKHPVKFDFHCQDRRADLV